MSKVLIVGAMGQLGRQMEINLSKDDKYEIIKADFLESDNVLKIDISDLDSTLKLIRDVKPDVVVNCAAYTAVDAQEKDVDASFKINALGPRNLAIASNEIGARIAHVSTDYVFPGDNPNELTEFDTPGPISVYGKSKLAGENFVKEMTDKFYTIRTAWLYGDGKNFVKTMLSLSETHDSLTVVNDQIGSPTSSVELANAITGLIETDSFGLYHGTCEDYCSWADFTKEIFKIKGIKTEVIPVTSEEYLKINPNSAPRPKFSKLNNYMLKLTNGYTFAHWRDAIELYLR